MSALPPVGSVTRAPATGAADADRRAAISAAIGATAWHAITAARAVESLAGSSSGLTGAEAERRAGEFGANEIPRRRGDGFARLLGRQVAQPLIYVLLVSSAVAVGLGHAVDAAVILGVVVVNALIGLIQERRAGRMIEGLLRLVPDDCVVIRDGESRATPVASVVPGDLLRLDPGDLVPADARLVDASGLVVDEATLTGESVPVDKSAAVELPADAPLADRSNMVYAGTLVAAGRATALVTATGAATELGRVSSLTAAAHPLATPLTRKVAAFGRRLSAVILALAAITFAVAELRGLPTGDALLAALALAVAAIPEGLPAIMTIALATGVHRMAARGAVARNLPSVETLGSTTVICTDKTGTLTRGEMMVAETFTGRTVTIGGSGFDPSGSFSVPAGVLDIPPDDVRALLEAALLCGNAKLVRRDDGWTVEGDPMEGAIAAAAAKARIEHAAVLADHPRVHELPFAAETRFMATVHAGPAGAAGRAIIKGAPEVIVPRCGAWAWPGEWDSGAALAAAAEMARRGLRVIAVAAKRQTVRAGAAIGADLTDGYELVGLLGVIDPPRPEAARAIATCHTAGVRVVMLTGDHPLTAAAIARDLGIARAGQAALTGVELEGLSESELERVAAVTPVFSRVMPEDKLRLVAALQRTGEIVAVTGDGVNDAPALRQADIGVAMGVSGSDAAREAADMVLRDDDFATIERAVEEGRRVYDNLIKSIVFILPTSAGLALLVLQAIALGLTLPIAPVQVLWINLITTVALALPLALERIEPDAMRRPPRRPGEPVLGRMIVQRIVLVAAFMVVAGTALFEYKLTRGATADHARGAVVTCTVLIEAFYLLNCRSLRYRIDQIGLFSNPSIFAGIALVVTLQLAFIYLPFMNDLFSSRPLDAVDLALSAAVAALVVPLVALEKLIRRRSRRMQPVAPPFR